MPSITFDFTAEVATRLSNAGIDKARVIELVKAELAQKEAEAVIDAEQAKVETAEQAKQTAINTAVADAQAVEIV
jgi:hypothetical protein